MRQIDAKYQTSGDITKADGAPVPIDEPLMLFRAKDTLLPSLLDHYKQLCELASCPPEQIQGIEAKIQEIRVWQAGHPEAVKAPD